MNWTNDQMETLSRLWMEGRTAGQIADSLGNGFTRNAVIGKAHRLRLSTGENVGLRAEAIAASRNSGDRVSAITKKAVAARPTSVTIFELTDDACRWPVDDPGSAGFRYCGAPSAGAAPYCVRHSKLAYQPTKPVRRPPDRNALFPGLIAVAPKA